MKEETMTRLIRSIRSRARGMLFLEQRSDASCEETGGAQPVRGKRGWDRGPVPRERASLPSSRQDFPWAWGCVPPCQALTEAGAHAAGDLQQDAGVAADHDEQREQEEAGEAHHVVEGLVPGPGEAATRGALGEVVRGTQGDCVEQEQLAQEMGVIRVCNSRGREAKAGTPRWAGTDSSRGVGAVIPPALALLCADTGLGGRAG